MPAIYRFHDIDLFPLLKFSDNPIVETRASPNVTIGFSIHFLLCCISKRNRNHYDGHYYPTEFFGLHFCPLTDQSLREKRPVIQENVPSWTPGPVCRYQENFKFLLFSFDTTVTGNCQTMFQAVKPKSLFSASIFVLRDVSPPSKCGGAFIWAG